MKIFKFIKKGIHYIKETHPNGAINIYPDPKFQEDGPEPIKPPLPPLSSTGQRLNFIINELHLKDRFAQ
ncbi:hypothetical protein ES703_11888 [subsurface metagenome]